MKKIKALIPLLLISLSLTGCNANESSAPTSASSDITESVSSTAEPSAVTSSAIVSAVSSPPVFSSAESSPAAPVKTELTRSDFGIIANRLKVLGELCYGLHPAIGGEYCPPYVDMSQTITEELTRKGSSETYTETYYKLSGTQYRQEAELKSTLDFLFTKKFQEQFRNSTYGTEIRAKDGVVYVAAISRDAPGSIKQVKLDLQQSGDSSILATVTYKPSDDKTETYHATFVKEEDNRLYKLDSLDENDSSMFMIPMLFCDNVEVISEQFALGIKANSDTEFTRLPERDELAEILRLLDSFTYWQDDVFHFMNKSFDAVEDPMYDFADPEQTIFVSEEESDEYEKQHEEYLASGTYIKAVKSPLSSAKELDEFLDTMMTENFKEMFYKFNNGYTMLLRDGSVYFHHGGGGASSRGLGQSYLELNSVGFTDDNTVLMRFTDVGDKDEWGLDKDIREEFTVKLVRGSDGKFRFDDGDYNKIALDLTFYRGMVYGDRYYFN